jgi:hypothetical protein
MQCTVMVSWSTRPCSLKRVCFSSGQFVPAIRADDRCPGQRLPFASTRKITEDKSLSQHVATRSRHAFPSQLSA